MVDEKPAGVFAGTFESRGRVIVFNPGPPYALYEVPGRGRTPNRLISPEGIVKLMPAGDN